MNTGRTKSLNKNSTIIKVIAGAFSTIIATVLVEMIKERRDLNRTLCLTEDWIKARNMQRVVELAVVSGHITRG